MKKDRGLPPGIAWGILVVLTVFVWGKILLARPSANLQFYFLDVGQGDATLVVLPGGVSFLTDSGPDRAVVDSLRDAVGERKYIDLAIISHPQLDHFNGFNHLLETHRFGAFLINGRGHPSSVEWESLIQKIRTRDIPLVVLGAGDLIRHASNTIEFLSPDASYRESAELNDTGIVERIRSGNLTALFTADIGNTVEQYIAGKFAVAADILKVAHHGSKYSSSEDFLKAVRPRVAVIEVGARNRYGHPAPEALARLASFAPLIFRTDRDGTVKIEAFGPTFRVFTRPRQ